MKKSLALSFLFFFYAPFAYSQVLHVDSTRFITGTRCCTQINYTIPTNDKGILFVGSEHNTPGGIIPNTDYIGDNVMVGKIDSNHQLRWIKIYGGNGDDFGASACQTPDGGYAILATTNSADGDVTGYKGQSDVWLVRIDDTGKLLGQKCYGSSLAEGAISIATTVDQGFVLLGVSNGSNGDVPYHYGSYLYDDWLLVKTDSIGTVQWSKDIGGTRHEVNLGSILAVDNNYYLVSSSSSRNYDCSDTVWHAGVNTNNDNHIIRLDDTGKILWDSSYGGSGDESIYYAFFDVRDSTIMTIGPANSDDYMVTGLHVCGDAGDMWLTKVSKNGALLWQKTLGTMQDETGTGICATPNGYITYGQTFPNACHDGTISIGLQDCLLYCVDMSGNILNVKAFGGVDGERPTSIVPQQNSFIATGVSGSSVFTEGTSNVNSSGAFITYLDTFALSVAEPYNKQISISVFPNPASSKIIIQLAENMPGNIVVFNGVGEVLYNEKIQPTLIGQKELYTSNWPGGLYFVKWQGADGRTLTKKIIKY
jgi:hypothetical protein